MPYEIKKTDTGRFCYGDNPWEFTSIDRHPQHYERVILITREGNVIHQIRHEGSDSEYWPITSKINPIPIFCYMALDDFLSSDADDAEKALLREIIKKLNGDLTLEDIPPLREMLLPFEQGPLVTDLNLDYRVYQYTIEYIDFRERELHDERTCRAARNHIERLEKIYSYEFFSRPPACNKPSEKDEDRRELIRKIELYQLFDVPFTHECNNPAYDSEGACAMNGHS